MRSLAVSLLLLAGALPAAQLEFSHELHLGKVGLECGACHSAATASDEETDNLLPAADTCLACHNGQFAPEVDVSALREREPVERNFWFNHEQHLALGNPAPVIAAAIDSGKYLGFVPDIREDLETENSCVGCHRGLDEAAKVDSALHLPQMSDCLVCHDQIEAPFSCEECHPAGFQLKPASHTPEFWDLHSSGKLAYDKRTCEVCHGRTFTCMGCH